MKCVFISLAAGALAAVSLDFSISNSYSSNKNFGPGRQIQTTHRTLDNSGSLPDLNASLTSSYNFYHAKVLVGTPPQEMDMLLDTGSPVSWVYGPEGSFNGAPKFYPNHSSTFHWLNDSFSAAYGSGNYIGHWGSDLVGTSSEVNSTAPSTQVEFDIGVISSFAVAAGAPGLLGLGPHISYAGPSTYQSLPEALYSANVTSSPGFSVYLDGDKGKFIFGGVDIARVNPPFWRYSINDTRPAQIVSPNQEYQSNNWNVRLDTVSFNHGDAYPVNAAATLDTGSPVSLLPPGFVKLVGEAFNLNHNADYDAYYTNSTSGDMYLGWVTFQLGELSIDIATQDLFVPGELIWLDDGPQGVYALSMLGSSQILLGDAFFRHVYTVFDGQREEILISRRSVGVPEDHSHIIPLDDVKNIRNGSKPVTVTTAYVTDTIVTSVTGTAPLLQNMYLGTVNEKDAATMSGDVTSSAAANSTATSAVVSTGASSSPSSKATGSSSSTSASTSASASTSSKSNGATALSVAISAMLIPVFALCL